ncbi:hypothetical protein GCM10028784_36690 [Myceligenerans cantabricum]
MVSSSGPRCGCRRLARRLLAWLTRMTLGCVKHPVYVAPDEVAAVAPRGAYITV